MTKDCVKQQTGNKDMGLPYEMKHIPDELKQKAKAELFEDEDTRVNSLRLLRSMLQDEAHLNWQDDDLFLLAFLRARKFDVKRAFNLVKTYYTVVAKRHELYSNFDYSDVRRTLQNLNIGYLPYRDNEGCVILIVKTGGWNPHEVSMGDFMRALTCGLLVSILSPATQIAGFKVIFDYTGVTLDKLPYVSPTYLWLLAEALQNCFPGRFRAVHMVNESYLWGYVWSILKQPLRKKLRDRFHFHGKNYTKLHKYFSPSILPAEYDGEMPPFDNSEWMKLSEENAEYLAHVFSHGYHKQKTRAEKKKTTASK